MALKTPKKMEFGLRRVSDGKWFVKQEWNYSWSKSSDTWSTTAQFFSTKQQIEHDAHRLHLDFLIGSATSDVEIVCITYEATKHIVETPKVSDAQLLYAKIIKHINMDVAQAYKSGVDNRIDMSKFKFAVRRKGGKTLMEEQFEHSYSWGLITFFVTDDDMMVAKLILGEKFGKIYNLDVVRA